MHVDAAFKRSFVPMVAVLIAAAAYFQALGMRALVGGVLSDAALAPAPPWRRVPRSALVGLDGDHTTDAAPLLARDPFSSSKAPAELPAAEPVAPCASTRVVLIAASDDAWSFAAIAEAGQPPILRRAGDQVAGYSVAAIESDGVWLVAGSTRCRAGLGAPAVAAEPPPPKKEVDPARSAGRKRGATLPPEIAGGIRQVGERAYDIERSAFNAILERQAELIGSLRALPEKEGDRVVGVRLMGLRPGSLLAAIGMQNGDRLTKINGVEVGDPATMMSAYTRLRGADHLVVSILRGGAPLNVDLHVR